MGSSTRVRMTPTQRLSRGLKYTAIGPVDVTRGAVGLGVDSVRSSAAWAGDRYRNGKLARQLKDDLSSAQQALTAEFSAAQEVVAGLPEALAKARAKQRRRKRLLWVGVGVTVVAGAAAVFTVARQSAQPEPSPRPPSVEVTPKP
ncbi:cell wall synthesis protein CwsA [Mycolicibacterium duvalii]|uniref:Cell wall synthesis protein CwsA n=1 Tax=Mycolicibacterium duvalii TaxID=39688 RepID=A0A7I7K5H8_9MYCO|nr:cell wall synthesis protein CwsA [Mycolicibacterium duvalii]MCV7365949.1 cell wall synthesis protein CwsA [Mycolicibacterium duvalii]PEG34987.1 cell wall synthesis protein CwsA [Mycolicibacterium duvalii]BBX19390.1 cell wall synthesis protein CwsA [Mycolicibacterium duvalii]